MSQNTIPSGTPSSQVRIGDIKAKLKEIDTEVRGATEVDKKSGHTLTLLGVAVAVALVILAFVLGRERGERKTTWVEVRRL